jgi:putative ribosome biogenesis GTPase RsgA
LTVALGTDEHSGRVRAMGRGHGFKSVFGHAKRREKPPEDVQQMVDDAVAVALEKQKQQNISEREEFGQRLTEQFEAKIASMMLKFSAMQTPLQAKQVDDVCVDVVSLPPSDKASSPDPFSNLPAVSIRL